MNPTKSEIGKKAWPEYNNEYGTEAQFERVDFSLSIRQLECWQKRKDSSNFFHN